ncbi:GMC family oxidoreductase [candidate division KSB1 bacterium]|nr:GMC family oxidoreductase [candidate division KSB1 bacterium]
MFTIRFKTIRFRPDLQVTIRTSVENWQEDLAGNYEVDEWIFRLSSAQYQQGMFFKFILEEEYWMQGGNLYLRPETGGDYVYDNNQVNFPPIDEVLVENGYIQQRFFEPNLDENHHYDVIVIGSGIGGGVLADQLSDYGLDVLVLEAGSYLVPTHVGNLPRQHQLARSVDKNIWDLWDDFKVTNYQNADGSQFKGGQGFNLGGRSVFWGALIPRMTWWELAPWAEEIRWYLEDRGYDLAEQLLKKTQLESDYQKSVKTFLKTTYPDYVSLTAPLAIQHTVPELRTVPAGIFSTADLLMESRLTRGDKGSKYLTINLNHAVVNIKTEGKKATSVVALDLISDKQRIFKANHVVLAAGTLESAKLAKLSNLADPNNKAGIGFTDHPIFYNHFSLPASSPLFNGNAASKVLLRHKNAGMDANAPHRYNIVLELGADFNQGRFIDPDILAEHEKIKGNTMLCEIVFLFHAPLMEANHLDQNGPSYVKPILHMQECPITVDEWNEIDGLKNNILNAIGAEPLANSNLNLVRADLGGVAHEVGTLRMGTNQATGYTDGVVDTNLKFLNYDNLYACDLSVFPSSPAANPTLTLTALALRLAEHLTNA